MNVYKNFDEMFHHLRGKVEVIKPKEYIPKKEEPKKETAKPKKPRKKKES